MRALRAALSQREPEYTASTTRSTDFLVDPCAVQDHVPMWVGGRTFRSLRRASSWATVGRRSACDRRARRDAGAPRTSFPAGPFDVLLQNEHPLDPIAEPDRVAEQLQRFASIGATGLNVRFVHHCPAHYCDQLAALKAVAPTM